VIRLLRAGKKEDRKMRKTAGGKEVEVDGMTGVERKLEEMGDNITQVSYSRCRWMDDYEQYVEYDKKTSKCSILNDEYDKNFIPAKLLFQYIKAEPRTRQECEFYFKGRGLNKMAFYGAKNKLELGRPVGGKYLIDDNYNAPDWCKNLPAYEEENSKVDVNDSFSIKGPKIVHSKDLANGDMSNAKEVIKEVSNEN